MTNLDITKSSFSRTIFFTPVIVKYLEKDLDIYNETSLCRTNFASPLALRYIDVPLYCYFYNDWVSRNKRHFTLFLDKILL